MIELLFFILKWIGWVVLGILGLLLGILLLVLFGALRYRLDGKKADGFEGKLCVTWLFRSLSVVVGYQEGIIAQVKLLGRTVWKLDGKEGCGGEDEAAADRGNEGGAREEPGPEGSVQRKPKTEDGVPKDSKMGSAVPEDILLCDEERKKQKEEENAKRKTERRKTKIKKKEKLAAWIEKLRFSFSEICGKLKRMDEKRQWLGEKWNQISAMVQDPDNQASVRLILRQTKKIFCHILPRKGLAEVTFGREDPYLMGKLLSYAGVAYPFLHKVFVLHPVFGVNCLKGEVHIRGRIRLGVILGCILRLLFNKNIRQKLKEVRYGR